MDEVVLVLKNLEQCQGNKKFISEALRGDISYWAGELKDTEDDIT